MRTFLLEKVRLVRQSEGERNYHVFYLLTTGASDEEREEMRLQVSAPTAGSLPAAGSKAPPLPFFELQL